MALPRVLADDLECRTRMPQDDAVTCILGTRRDEKVDRRLAVVSRRCMGELTLDNERTLDGLLSQR